MKRPQFSLAGIFGFTAGFAAGLWLLRASVHNEKTYLLLASLLFLLCALYLFLMWTNTGWRGRDSISKTSVPNQSGEQTDDCC